MILILPFFTPPVLAGQETQKSYKSNTHLTENPDAIP
jgi:hypothetical protein